MKRSSKTLNPIVRAFAAGTAVLALAAAIPSAHAASSLSNHAVSGTDDGDIFVKHKTRFVGTNDDVVNVQFDGFRMYSHHGDMQSRELSAMIRNQNYNRTTGLVSFTVLGRFEDRWRWDDYTWVVYYTLLTYDH